MKTLIIVLVLFIKYQGRFNRNIRYLVVFCLDNKALSCYQCAMKYSNDECNSNNSTYFTECQPTFDTCLTMVLKPGRILCSFCDLFY